jgi:hypothetical protein
MSTQYAVGFGAGQRRGLKADGKFHDQDGNRVGNQMTCKR